MASDIKSRAVRGMAWVLCEKFSLQALQFLLGIVMARLLAPSDYGVVGMLAIFLAISSLFVDSGFGAALIQKKDRTEVDYATVFYFNLIVASFFYLVLFVAAPYIAEFYKMPILTNVCRVVALGLPMGALCSVHRSRLTIQLNFKLQTLISLASLIVTGSLGVFLAYRGYGVWALVWQGFAGSVVSIVLLWSLTRWHPMLAFSMASFRRFFSFGWKHLCSSLINCVYGNLYSLVIGKAFGATDIGYFTRANSYAQLPAGTVSDTVIRVNFPILSQLQDDREKLLRAYNRLLQVPMFFLVPLAFGLAVTAEPLITIMIGEKWLPCAPLLSVLCFGSIFNPLTYINLNLLYVKGRTDYVLKLEIMKKPIAFAIVLGTIPFGIFWMCVGKAVYDVIAFCINCHYTKKLLSYGLWAQVKEILPIIANGLAMVVVVHFAMKPFCLPWIKLLAGTVSGAVFYLGVAFLTRDAALYYALDMLEKNFCAVGAMGTPESAVLQLTQVDEEIRVTR